MTQERRRNGATMAQPKGSEGRLAPLRHSPGLKARGNGENERRSLPPRGQNGAENGAGMAQGTAHDPVNHPTHYTAHPSGVECIQITEHMSFCLGNAVKYIWRADLKADAIEDLKKARWYLDREIARRGNGA